MSDFLSSLRGIARRTLDGSSSVVARQQSAAQVRQTQAYRTAAAQSVDRPQSFSGFSVADRYSAVEDAQYGRASGLLANDLSPNKTVVEQARDTAADITGGLATGAVNLTALAASSVNAPQRMAGLASYDLGVPISRFAEDTGEFFNNLGTVESRSAAAAHEARQRVLTEDNRFEEQAALEAGANPLFAGAQRIIRDVRDTGANLLDTPEALGQGIAEGVGSLLLGGPASRGATSVVAVGTRAFAARGLMSPRLAAIVSERFAGASMTGTIAAMESGGAYTQAANQVMSMSHSELMEGSPQYVELIERGIDQDRAKNMIASRAGGIAAAIQAPIAAAAGRLVSGFEAAPFARSTVLNSLSNIGKEFVEEGVQSFSGAASSNAGVRFAADEDFDMSEGLGRGLAEGAIFGAGTGAVFGAPNAVADALDAGVNVVNRNIRRVFDNGNKINNANRVDEQNEARASVNAVINPVQASVDATVASDEDTNEQIQNAPILEQLNNSFRFNPEARPAQNPTEQLIYESVDPSTPASIFDVMETAVEMLEVVEEPSQKLDLAILINDLQSQVSPENFKELGNLQDRAIPGGTLATQVSQILKAQNAISNNKAFRDALSKGIAATPEVTVNDIGDLSTPQQEQAAKKIAIQAVLEPENVSPEVVKAIRLHSKKRASLFSPNQELAIRSSAVLNKTYTRAREDAELMGVEAPKPVRVSEQVQSMDSLNYDKSSTGPSVRMHYDKVLEGLSTEGDTAVGYMQQFRNFAQHMANKLNAVNKSYQSRVPGKTEGGDNPNISFDVFSPSPQGGTWKPDGNSIGVLRFSPSSIALGQQVGVDAEYAIDTYNDLLAQNPQLGLEPVEAVRLDSGLKQPPKAVLKAAQDQQKAESIAKKASVKTETKPSTKPVVESKPAVEVTKPEPELDAKPTNVENLQDETLPTLVALLKEFQELKDEVKFERVSAELRVRKLEAEAAKVNSKPEAADVVAEPEAQPEVTATEEAAPEEEAQSLKMEEVFNDLIIDNGQNLFLEGYSLSKESRTKLLGTDAISSTKIKDAVTKPEVYKEVTGESGARITDKTAKAYTAIIGAVTGKVITHMNERLAGKSLLSKFQKGVNPKNQIATGDIRLLNLMQRAPDGSLEFHPTILKAAVFALSDYIAQNSVTKPHTKDDKIAEILGYKDALPSEAVIKGYNSGTVSSSAKLQVLDRLTKYLGVKANKDTPNGLSEGILLSLADELIKSADATNVLNGVATNDQDIPRYFVSVNKEALGFATAQNPQGLSLEGSVGLIDEVITNDMRVKGYDYKPSGHTSEFQMSSNYAETTEAQRALQIKSNAVANYVNTPMVQVLAAIDVTGVLDLFGFGSVLPDGMNINTRVSRESKNNSLLAAFRTMVAQTQEMIARAKEADVTLDKIALYREYEISAVQRLQQLGLHGDQSSKLIRETITPYGGVQDLSDYNSPASQLWRRALAQAFGVKVEKLHPDTIERKLAGKIGPENEPINIASKLLFEVLSGNKVDQAELIAALKKAKIDSPAKLHALVDYTRHSNATPEEQAAFYSHAYVEADGIADGVTNSVMYMWMGPITEDFTQTLATGGVFFSEKPKAAYEYFNANGDDVVLPDTYEKTGTKAAELMKIAIQEAISKAKPGSQVKVQAYANAVITLLQALMDNETDFRFVPDTEGGSEGNFTFMIGRGVLKNPTTVSVYGSSANGVANKIAGELIKEIYNQISRAAKKSIDDTGKKNSWRDYMFDSDAQLSKNFWNSLEILRKKKLVLIKGEYDVWNNKEAGTIRDENDPIKFTFDNDAFLALSNSLRTLYVDPMIAAINSQMTGSITGAKVVQKATNMMSAIALTMFESMVGAELKKKTSKSQGLSPNDLRKIIDKVAFLLPYLQGDEVNVFVKGLERNPMVAYDAELGSAMDISVGANLTEKTIVQLPVTGPAIAGVAGSAFLNIAYGDGRMIIKASPGITGGHLNIFDGINLAMKDAIANGKTINRAVIESYLTGTPFADLKTAFTKLSTLNEFKNWNEYDKVMKIIAPYGSKESLQELINGLSSDLDKAELGERALKYVLKNVVHLSSDHMAALGAPASTEEFGADRIDLSGLSLKDQAVELNRLVENQKAIFSKEKIVAPKEDLTDSFTPFKEKKGNLRIFSTNQLRNVIKDLNIPEDQKQIIRSSVIALAGKDWKIALGNREDINAYAKKNGVAHQFASNEFGLADPNTKTILIVSNSSETLAHELVHAATMSVVNAYYADPKSLSSIDVAAVQRLELLMNDWLNNAEDFAAIRVKSISDAVNDAVTAVDGFMKNNDPAAALNEFIAWNMTNQQLLALNKEIKVESKLAQITEKVLAVLGALFKFPFGKDLTSNIRFNVAVLMRKDAPSIKTEMQQSIMRHAGTASDRVKEVTAKFGKLVASADAPLAGLAGPKLSTFALDVGHKLALQIEKIFDMTVEERHAFTLVVAAYRANMVRDAKANVQLDAYYSEIIEQMDQSILMDDPASLDPAEQNKASARMDLLRGSFNLGVDNQDRSMVLPVVVALAATNAQAQKMFNRMTVKNPEVAARGTTVDSFLTGLFTNGINSLMAHTYGIRPDRRVGEEINKIVLSLAAQVEAERSLLNEALSFPGDIIREGNTQLSDGISTVLTKVSEVANQGLDKLQGTRFESAANGFGRLSVTALDIMNKRLNASATAKLTSMMNESDTPRSIKSIVAELMGINEGNQNILVLMKQGRALIDKLRQAYRKAMPEAIAAKFSRVLTKDEWRAQHVMGQMDMSTFLDQGLDVRGITDLLADPTKANQTLLDKEVEIKRLFKKDAATILREADELANRMVTGKPAHGLVKRNALAIANRAGEAVIGSFDWTSDEVLAIEGYTSLLALSRAEPAMLNVLKTLATTEAEGLQYTLSLISKARSHEMERVPESLKYNIDKGYMPYERKGTFRAVSPQSVNDFVTTGYKIVGARVPSAVEDLYSTDTGFVYVATDLDAPIFRQGIMRTVRSTVFGLDMLTGRSAEQPSAGLITDPKVVAKLNVRLQSRLVKDAALAPLYNDKGKIYAYERLVDPADVKAALETQQNAAVALGQWMGRQHEEHHSAILNQVTLERLAEMYSEAIKTGEDTEYIDLALKAETDPVIADAMRLIGNTDLETAFAKTGGKFMVRDDLYENLIGMRSISIGDLWSGNTNIPEHHRIAIADFMTGILGPNTYRRLVSSEQAWQSLMGDARTAIVVKSVLVPALNAMANFFQLMANGIGPVQIALKSAEFLQETHFYAQNEIKTQKLNIELAVAEGEKRPDKIRLIETQLRKIEDVNKRLTIWPLIEAGEFGQITEGLTDSDLEMTNGGLWNYVSKLADKLPPAVKTAGRYAVVAKDTALFAGLARTVAYTDFVAKAVLYEHLTLKEKLPKKDALLRITNEFVNYDLLSGREMAYAESMGLIWFPKFKIRGVKVAASLMRNNPLHTFLSSLVPGSYEAGTVMDDNGVSLFLDNRLDKAFGIGNALRALDLNIFRQIFGGR